MRRTIHAKRDEINALFQKAFSILDDIELQSHLARYLCILVSGFIEESIRVIIANYANYRASRDISNFVVKKLDRETNMKMQKILSLLEQFDSEYKDRLNNIVNDEMKNAIDSIINNRHAIAHGRNISLSLHNLKTWFRSVNILIDELSDIFHYEN